MNPKRGLVVERIAIIGTGIAGLGTAYFLNPQYELLLFEASAHIGGHVNTIDVPAPSAGQTMPLDTGFMVFNRVTYPLLCRLFEELGVETQPSDMSFSAQNRLNNVEWGGASINQVFGQRRNLMRPSFWRFIKDLQRFNLEAPLHLERPELANQTVADYVKANGFGQAFVSNYLLPMGSAIWSTAPQRMLDFPAAALIRFFHNHGFLGMDTHYQWYTVTGGARSYVQRLIKPFAHKIRINTPVARVASLPNGEPGWTVTTETGAQYIVDKVVMACHADQALQILEDPPTFHQTVLSAFLYERNQATVHSDARVMPKRRRVWSAWNYRLRQHKSGNKPLLASTHYWMNRLQSLPGKTHYFVSINDRESLTKTKAHYQVAYEHPLYRVEALKAQSALPRLQNHDEAPGLYFAGSYWRHGFHEDAFGSAVWLTRRILGEAHPWKDLPENPWPSA
jgi:uncharacterized protein